MTIRPGPQAHDLDHFCPEAGMTATLGAGIEIPEGLLRSANRHFAAAASRLARDQGCSPEDSKRYTSASAYFRALIEAEDGHGRHVCLEGPAVSTHRGEAIPLVALFLDACQRYRMPLPPRSLDPGLIHEASTLLSGLPWHLPERAGVT